MKRRLGGRTLAATLMVVLLATVPTWETGPVLNQGPYGACAGYTASAWLAARPGPRYQYNGLVLYQMRKQRDGYKGEGTFPAVMADILREEGYLKSYRTSTVVTDAIHSLVTGPFWLGVKWYEGMQNPIGGIITDTGSIRGRHEFMCYGYDEKAHQFLCQNSWGPYWGNAGRMRIHTDVAQRRLYGNSDAILMPVKATLQERFWLRLAPR